MFNLINLAIASDIDDSILLVVAIPLDTFNNIFADYASMTNTGFTVSNEQFNRILHNLQVEGMQDVSKES